MEEEESPNESKHVNFQAGQTDPAIPDNLTEITEVPSQVQVKEKTLRKRFSKKKSDIGSTTSHIVLDDIASDASDAPRQLQLEEVCHVQNEDTALGNPALTADEYLKQRSHSNQEFDAKALSSLESLAPFV